MVGLGFYSSTYKKGIFTDRQVATCQHCEGKVVFWAEQESPVVIRGAWLHDGIDPEHDEGWSSKHEAIGHKAEPKEFCMERMQGNTAYSVCGTPVKYEEREMGNYACGRHLKNFTERKALAARRRKEEEERQRALEIEEFEITQYSEAERWLRDLLGDELFGSNHPYRERGWAELRRKTLDRHVNVDWFELYTLLRDLTEGKEDDEQDLREEVEAVVDAADVELFPWDV